MHRESIQWLYICACRMQCDTHECYKWVPCYCHVSKHPMLRHVNYHVILHLSCLFPSFQNLFNFFVFVFVLFPLFISLSWSSSLALDSSNLLGPNFLAQRLKLSILSFFAFLRFFVLLFHYFYHPFLILEVNEQKKMWWV